MVTIRGPGAVSTSVRDVEDGTYAVSWVANVSGVYWIAVSLHGEHIQGSPFAAQVVVPTAAASHCRASGVGLHDAVAGERTGFRIDFADLHGRAVPAESLDLAIEAEGAGGDAAAAAGFSLGGLTPVDCEADGEYVANYSVRLVG